MSALKDPGTEIRQEPLVLALTLECYSPDAKRAAARRLLKTAIDLGLRALLALYRPRLTEVLAPDRTILACRNGLTLVYLVKTPAQVEHGVDALMRCRGWYGARFRIAMMDLNGLGPAEEKRLARSQERTGRPAGADSGMDCVVEPVDDELLFFSASLTSSKVVRCLQDEGQCATSRRCTLNLVR
jgi:hypothetical protein